MASLKNRIEQLLRSSLDHLDSHLERLPDGRVAGTIVSADFSGVDHDDRQKRLWKILDELPAESVSKVGAITALTPEEWSVEIPDLD